MRRSAFTVAKACLAAGCLAAAAALAAPAPRGSESYVAAHEARRAGRPALSPAPETLVAERNTPPTPLRDLFASPSGSLPAAGAGSAGPPPGHRIASTGEAPAPLAGLDPAVPPPAAEPAVTFRDAESETSHGLVPEPTPDPAPPAVADAGLKEEIRSLRQEVLRLAQAKAPQDGDGGDVTNQLRRLENELRSLRSSGGGAPADGTPAAPNPTAPSAKPPAPEGIVRATSDPGGLIRTDGRPEKSSGFVDANGIPQSDTTSVTTSVMVRDGSTAVIGDLIDEQADERLRQVPSLGSVTVVGHAFRNTNEKLVRSELIVMVAPRIVYDPVQEARGETLRSESERRAASFADNSGPASRRNLARRHVERAAELFHKGRLAEAHDHVGEALAIRKNDGDALRLKESIERAMRSRRRRSLRLPDSDPEVAPILWPAAAAPGPEPFGTAPAPEPRADRPPPD